MSRHNEQVMFSHKYLYPYLKQHIKNLDDLTVLVVGCGEGGVVGNFRSHGIECEGLEINEKLIEGDFVMIGDITGMTRAIPLSAGKGYDLIIMRDTIEHIHVKWMAFHNIRCLLNNGGYLYITFPPKHSAFAGHQQNLKTFLRYIPFVHLLPLWLLSLSGEEERRLWKVKNTYMVGMNISRFNTLTKRFNFVPVIKNYFISRPVFRLRYGLPTIRGNKLFCMGCEFLMKLENMEEK